MRRAMRGEEVQGLRALGDDEDYQLDGH